VLNVILIFYKQGYYKLEIHKFNVPRFSSFDFMLFKLVKILVHFFLHMQDLFSFIFYGNYNYRIKLLGHL